jgi:hypothetical protein
VKLHFVRVPCQGLETPFCPFLLVACMLRKLCGPETKSEEIYPEPPRPNSRDRSLCPCNTPEQLSC